MKWFRILMALAVLACFAPLASLAVSAWIASANDCTLHEGFVNPCVIRGVDWGSTLYSMAMLGWLMIATLPIAAGLASIWVIVEVVRWARRRRRASA